MTWRRLPARHRAPGFTVCKQCRQVVDNATLVEVARPGNTKGLHCCPSCADRLTGGNRA